MVYEFKGDIKNAIKYRKNEIKLMKKFLKLPESNLIKDIDYSDVHDRLILLALLYDKTNDDSNAIKSLKEAKKIAKKYKFSFGAQDLIDEIDSK